MSLFSRRQLLAAGAVLPAVGLIGCRGPYECPAGSWDVGILWVSEETNSVQVRHRPDGGEPPWSEPFDFPRGGIPAPPIRQASPGRGPWVVTPDDGRSWLTQWSGIICGGDPFRVDGVVSSVAEIDGGVVSASVTVDGSMLQCHDDEGARLAEQEFGDIAIQCLVADGAQLVALADDGDGCVLLRLDAGLAVLDDQRVDNTTRAPKDAVMVGRTLHLPLVGDPTAGALGVVDLDTGSQTTVALPAPDPALLATDGEQLWIGHTAFHVPDGDDRLETPSFVTRIELATGELSSVEVAEGLRALDFSGESLFALSMTAPGPAGRLTALTPTLDEEWSWPLDGRPERGQFPAAVLSF